MTKEKVAYRVRTIRISDESWEKLKEKRRMSGLSWNLFIVKIIEKK